MSACAFKGGTGSMFCLSSLVRRFSSFFLLLSFYAFPPLSVVVFVFETRALSLSDDEKDQGGTTDQDDTTTKTDSAMRPLSPLSAHHLSLQPLLSARPVHRAVPNFGTLNNPSLPHPCIV